MTGFHLHTQFQFVTIFCAKIICYNFGPINVVTSVYNCCLASGRQFWQIFNLFKPARYGIIRDSPFYRVGIKSIPPFLAVNREKHLKGVRTHRVRSCQDRGIGWETKQNLKHQRPALDSKSFSDILYFLISKAEKEHHGYPW